MSKLQVKKTEVKDRLIKMRRVLSVSAGIYCLFLLFSILFMGPFVFGLISSFKDKPDAWPPSLETAQLSPSNWRSMYRIAKQAGSSGFFGELEPGRSFSFEVVYISETYEGIEIPEPVIPRRVGFAGAQALQDQVFAADYAQISIAENRREINDDKNYEVSYVITVSNLSNKSLSRIPIDIRAARTMNYYKADVDPNRIEGRGRIQGWNNISGGVIPYIFNQYNRVFSENYSRATGRPLFLQWIFNSFRYGFFKVIITLMFASMAGYALSRLKFKGKTLIFAVLLFSMMIPDQVTFISNYVVLRDGLWGLSSLFGMDTLLNTYTGLIMQRLVEAQAIFIFKQFFEGLPVSLEESARIDGANTYQIFGKIMLPLAKPAMGAVTILTFQGAWNEFFMPLVLLTSPDDIFPLTVGFMSFQKTYAAGAFDWGPLLAGAVISAIPIVIMFIVFQRYFVEGVSFSGSKE